MCGICGFMSRGFVERSTIERMNMNMLHRGPNGDGFYFEQHIGLAMRRLSIIDLEGGWQPIYNEDKSLILFMNGEIYNYVELRLELEKRGHRFSTGSDAEVIVHLYEEHGADCVSALRGMFAVALWDKQQHVLMLARDRMGEKPLYYYHDQKKLLFASELRALLSSGMISRELEPESLNMFFRYQYIPEPYTIIKSVHKLPPATYLLIDESLNIQETCYWRLEDSPVITGDPKKIIAEKLTEVGRLIIRSAVPVGVALSGGIDSSLVAALSSRQYGQQMHAFTVGYQGSPKSDERNVASRIAKYLGLVFHEIELSTKDFTDAFPTVCTLCDDPISDISAFGYYSVSKASMEHGVPVLLQGQGGDELAWGYSWVRSCYDLFSLKKRIVEEGDSQAKWELLHMIVGDRLSHPRVRKNWKDLLGFRKYQFLLKEFQKYPDRIPFYDSLDGFVSNYSSLFGPLMKEYSNVTYGYDRSQSDSVDILLTKLICNTYLLENGVAQGDRLSMSNSVELRLPLLDYKLVETIIGLRKSNSDIYGTPKKVLKDVARDMLPEWLFNIPKRGFTPPVEEWTTALLGRYGDRLEEGNLLRYGIVNSKGAHLLRKGLRNPSIGFPLFFNALVLEFYLDIMEG